MYIKGRNYIVFKINFKVKMLINIELLIYFINIIVD